MNTTITPSSLRGVGATSGHRTLGLDVAIVLSTAAAFAHLVTTPDHYTWWPAAGVFFGILGAAQLGCAVLLMRGATPRLVLAGIWGTVAVILVYVASRTVGLPSTPPVPFHGTRWLAGQAMVPDGAKHVGPLDVFTLVVEVLLVVTLLGLLPSASRLRTANRLMWLGLALWGASFVFLF